MESADVAAIEPVEGRLAALFREHGHEAKRLVYLMTGDEPLSEDIAQEAFIRAGGRLVHLRDPERFPAYLRACVVNLVRAHWRRRRIEGSVPIDAGRPAAPEPEQVLDVRDALLRLAHRQRAAIVLRYYADLPDDEIAQLLRCRRGTVRSLVARGLGSMRAQMEEP